jgi:hypothetical protein
MLRLVTQSFGIATFLAEVVLRLDEHILVQYDRAIPLFHLIVLNSVRCKELRMGVLILRKHD